MVVDLRKRTIEDCIPTSRPSHVLNVAIVVSNKRPYALVGKLAGTDIDSESVYILADK